MPKRPGHSPWAAVVCQVAWGGTHSALQIRCQILSGCQDVGEQYTKGVEQYGFLSSFSMAPRCSKVQQVAKVTSKKAMPQTAHFHIDQERRETQQGCSIGLQGLCICCVQSLAFQAFSGRRALLGGLLSMALSSKTSQFAVQKAERTTEKSEIRNRSRKDWSSQ